MWRFLYKQIGASLLLERNHHVLFLRFGEMASRDGKSWETAVCDNRDVVCPTLMNNAEKISHAPPRETGST